MTKSESPSSAAVNGRNEPVWIAVDAMGADFAPTLAVDACALALRQKPSFRIRLFGDVDQLDPAVGRLPPELAERIELVAVAEAIDMDSSPAQALRRGGNSSMAQALDSLLPDSNPAGIEATHSPRANALVSSGNTGALMALARAKLGMLPGIERPALMTAFPVQTGRSWVLDLGANIGVDADRLFEFAVLGSAAVSALTDRFSEQTPKVGLLNIGTESNKGPDVIREAARKLEQSNLNYIGFVEGHDVFAGAADVVVCDGFAGNVLLKSAEGAVRMLLSDLQTAPRSWPHRKAFARDLERLQQRFDPRRHNGASLLGISGIVIKSHAHADAAALAQAIELALLETQRGMLPELERQLWAAS